ncbi:hypothetical protein BLNAU_18220 [Blattamonas nauphoetae]|uniref:Uncharacterized protein n=1 Tax=Blattamonas nauphoetae TaxID=2049346 RepID=A0ABQ9X7B3_9EUKA|nr:hypothetical protein BLNAU_18220 [Blattamonas nauphoetae]
MDCSPFMNWREGDEETFPEKGVVFLSLVATVKFQPAFDDSLVAKAVKFLESVDPKYPESADTFLRNLGRTPDDYSTNFIESILVLLSSASQSIIHSSMAIFHKLLCESSTKAHYALVNADLLPQLINILNPQSLSFAEAIDIHINVISIIRSFFWLITPFGLTELGIEDRDEQQDVHATVLQQVLVPSEKYICHLCVNCFSIIDGDQSDNFLALLARLLQISPFYQPTMDFVMNMPVVLTMPSCLSFFEDDLSISSFLYAMNDSQQKWNKQKGEVRQMWKKVHRMLRMEGMEDVTEEKLRNDGAGSCGDLIVFISILLNNAQGMNLQHLL